MKTNTHRDRNTQTPILEQVYQQTCTHLYMGRKRHCVTMRRHSPKLRPNHLVRIQHYNPCAHDSTDLLSPKKATPRQSSNSNVRYARLPCFPPPGGGAAVLAFGGGLPRPWPPTPEVEAGRPSTPSAEIVESRCVVRVRAKASSEAAPWMVLPLLKVSFKVSVLTRECAR